MKRERGRPRATTHAAIVEAAFELFREVGFESVTMPMIAARAGIGRATVFHYFSNKAEILWYTQTDTTEEFRTNLAAQPAGVDLADGAFAAYAGIWSTHADEIAIGKEMVRTIETSSPESTGKWRAYETWSGLVHDYVMARTGLPATDTAARAVAMAIWAAIWSAATEFALTDSDSIDEHLARARAAIGGADPRVGARGGLAI
ncbi:MAG: hypothetical protein BGO95_06525 [Micrococcales bacterium 73-13]|nr:MAG: hypothetical protein BGO95_06525 [Micrococcales bacterium 73-13]